MLRRGGLRLLWLTDVEIAGVRAVGSHAELQHHTSSRGLVAVRLTDAEVVKGRGNEVGARTQNKGEKDVLTH
jgi:hypothetical protein